jgi:hypothetical protein
MEKFACTYVFVLSTVLELIPGYLTGRETPVAYRIIGYNIPSVNNQILLAADIYYNL